MEFKKFGIKIIGIALSLSLATPIGVNAMNKNTENDISKKTTENNFTMEEIEKIFQKYLDENNINIKFGTSEYLDYIEDQIFEKKDKNLLKHPYYKLIDAYFAEYITTIQDKEIEENNNDDINLSIEELDNKEKNIEEIKNQNLNEEKQILKEKIKNRSYRSSRLLGYNTNAAKDYAVYWSGNDNKKDRYNLRYNTYSADCTNFVSQCLYAGGLKEKKPNGGLGTNINTYQYWYGHRPYSTTSWIRVADFYRYWAPKVSTSVHTIHNSLASKAKVGDIIQFQKKSTGTKWHSMIVTKKANNKIYVSGHSKHRTNYAFTNYSNAEDKWVLLSF